MRHQTPDTGVVVQDFRRFINERVELAKSLSDGERQPIWYVPQNRAVTTHGVHVYANLMDFNDKLVEVGVETSRSHADALQFLHQHYRACDALIQSFGIQRVDFHGPRLHAVVLDPAGDDEEVERVAKAVAFAAAFREMAERVGAEYGDGYRTRVRIGIDTGPAVAVNSGKKSEPEPLFIGAPANHAAKLAEGADEGVYLSPQAELVLLGSAANMASPQVLAKSIESGILDEQLRGDLSFVTARDRLEEAFAEVRASRSQMLKSLGDSDAVFRFHHREPPLKSIDFEDHPPSNSIRMELASIFCDLTGFTAYIDNAIATGRVGQAVANLHVIRGEMAAVLRDDFGGRKIRFIGDCLHGVIAEGDASRTDIKATIDSAVLASAGIRSSFELCQQMLDGINQLGIAIGIEVGPTPISRFGLRGESSVRCSTSRATCVSESEQSRCGHRETALGPEAYRLARSAIQRIFQYDRLVPNLNFANAGLLLGTIVPEPAVSSTAEPFRAHGR